MKSKDIDKALLAGSILTSPKKLKRLARVSNRRIRQRVASNSSASPATLMELAQDTSKDVRREVALNPEVSHISIIHLSYDSSADVRYAVAENVRTPVLVLQRMSTEEVNPYVRKRALDTLKNLEMYCEEELASPDVICHMDHLSDTCSR